MKPDLHCHSHFSDGKHSPDFLLKRAADNGITHLAITDHDCTTALEDTSLDCYGIKLIAGVEIFGERRIEELSISKRVFATVRDHSQRR